MKLCKTQSSHRICHKKSKFKTFNLDNKYEKTVIYGDNEAIIAANDIIIR
jgi:hypothetical protein